MVEVSVYKTRISVLWLLTMVAYFAYGIFATNEGAATMTVAIDQTFAVALLILGAMAYLSLSLGDRANRFLNVGAGAVVGLLEFIVLLQGIQTNAFGTYNFATAAKVVMMAAVVWLAYRWPKQTA